MISLDDFKKVELSVGEVLSAEKIPETDKLLKLLVDFGMKPAPAPAAADPASVSPPPTRDIRQIVSGISLYFPDPTKLVGRKCLFVTNLEPRSVRGLESNGMIVAASTDDGKFSLFDVSADMPPGVRAR